MNTIGELSDTLWLQRLGPAMVTLCSYLLSFRKYRKKIFEKGIHFIIHAILYYLVKLNQDSIPVDISRFRCDDTNFNLVPFTIESLEKLFCKCIKFSYISSKYTETSESLRILPKAEVFNKMWGKIIKALFTAGNLEKVEQNEFFVLNRCFYSKCDNLSEEIKLKKCSLCRCAFYCSRKCQKKDWIIHKQHCHEW